MQAYDGHMNLILSEVEESIMIVDPEESNAVRVSLGRLCVYTQFTEILSDRET